MKSTIKSSTMWFFIMAVWVNTRNRVRSSCTRLSLVQFIFIINSLWIHYRVSWCCPLTQSLTIPLHCIAWSIVIPGPPMYSSPIVYHGQSGIIVHTHEANTSRQQPNHGNMYALVTICITYAWYIIISATNWSFLFIAKMVIMFPNKKDHTSYFKVPSSL